MPSPRSPIAPLAFGGRHFPASEVEMIREVAAVPSSSITVVCYPGLESKDWRAKSWGIARATCPAISSAWTGTGRSCWKPGALTLPPQDSS
jgi:hypothetical protein